MGCRGSHGFAVKAFQGWFVVYLKGHGTHQALGYR